MKQAWRTTISHPDNSINNHFSFTGRKQETSEHDFTARVHVMLQSVSLLGGGDKSGGRVKNVNMSAGLAGYSQLLLHDLSRDLMLISKNTESWRLSMVFLQSFGSAQETGDFYMADQISPKCHLKKRSSHLGLLSVEQR